MDQRAARECAAGLEGELPLVPSPFLQISGSLLSSYRFNVSTEFLPHGREDFFGERVLLPRSETHEQRRREDIHRNSFTHGGFDCHSAFAEVLNNPAALQKSGI